MDKIFIVMDYVEHDLKSLMETMKQPFLEGMVCKRSSSIFGRVCGLSACCLTLTTGAEL